MRKKLAYAIRKSLIAFVATGILVGVTVLICEVGFRMLLFSQVAFMERFREPNLYTDYFSDDDWWKLYYAFNKPANDTAKHPHPLLGWAGDFDGETYRHHDMAQVGARQPVLLYGDSFAHCVTPATDCFQGILNSDPAFSTDHYVLNYGTAGYGVDQIYLLLRESLPLFEKPRVIVGIHTRDLDRSAMRFFVGNKPYFDVVKGELELKGVPVSQDGITTQSPRIWSYLYRLWLYQDGAPMRLKHALRGTDEDSREKLAVNTLLVQQMIGETKDLPVLFVIFASQDEVARVGWQERFLTEQFENAGVPYFSNRVLIQDDQHRTGVPLADYYIATDGHPNAYQNLLVSKELKRRLLLNDDALLRKEVATRSDEHTLQ